MAPPASIVIAGASLAGTRCASALRRRGFGGRISLIGAEVHAPYDRPPLSKQYLAGEWDRERLSLVADDEWADLDLDWRGGVMATGLDVAARTVMLADGTECGGEAVVVATGSRPRRLARAPAIDAIHVLRTVDDADRLRASLAGGPIRAAVVGAGFIGAEVASTMAAGGHAVTIVEAEAVPLRRGLGDRIGSICSSLHTDSGVDLRLRTTVESFEATAAGGAQALQLSDGQVIEVDLIVVGIGVVPNTEWLGGSGLEVDDGVVCNEFCEAAPGVFAVGDVARWYNPRFGEAMRVEHWENAIDQGSYVAGRILGEEDGPFAPVPWFWSDQYGHKLQLAGRPSAGDRVEVITGSVEERRFAAVYGRGDRLTGVFGLNRPRHVMQYRRLITEGASWSDALSVAQEARTT